MTKSADGLGICRECKHFKDENYPEHVEIGSAEYYNALCLRSSDVYRLCRHVRTSLNKCPHFKSGIKSSFQTLIDLLKAIFESIRNNSWESLKKAVDRELQTGIHRKTQEKGKEGSLKGKSIS